MRNSFVGLAGNFGTFLIGRHDTPYKISFGKLDLFADTMADFNWTVGFNDLRADSVIAYISPSWSGFQLAGAVIPSGGATPLGTFNQDANGIADAWSIAAIYTNGPFYGSAGYEVLGKEHWKKYRGRGIDLQDWYEGLYNKSTKDDTKWGIGLGCSTGTALPSPVDTRDAQTSWVRPSPRTPSCGRSRPAIPSATTPSRACTARWTWRSAPIPGTSGFNLSCDKGLDLIEQKNKDTWGVAFDHNFSKRTRAYALYTKMDDDRDDSDWSAFSLGMIHKF